MKWGMRLAALAAMVVSGSALAQGYAVPGQMGFIESVTPVGDELHRFHNMLLIIITGITVFVLGLLAYICLRFRRSANPVPSKTTHNTLLEVVWTGLPVLILVLIAIPSLRLLYFAVEVPEADMTVKVVGNQWFWSYEYPDHGGFGFDSNMKEGADLGPDDLRLLSVDNHIVVPVNKTVRVQVTAADVIHAWAIPALGVKIDAVPGKLNETWFKAVKEGTYYGQCSELCGIRHGFMPIRVDVVSEQQFNDWVEQAKQKFAGSGATPGVTLAASH